MKRSPLIPFAATAVIGILLIVVLSLYGDNLRDQAAKDKEGGGTAEATPKEVYLQNCASCHGDNLGGGGGPSLKKVGSRMSKDEILKQIQQGGGGMPGGIIQGEAAQNVAEWLAKMK